jgi:hypothetical protein
MDHLRIEQLMETLVSIGTRPEIKPPAKGAADRPEEEQEAI